MVEELATNAAHLISTPRQPDRSISRKSALSSLRQPMKISQLKAEISASSSTAA
jgi:hypothetical protein